MDGPDGKDQVTLSLKKRNATVAEMLNAVVAQRPDLAPDTGQCLFYFINFICLNTFSDVCILQVNSPLSVVCNVLWSGTRDQPASCDLTCDLTCDL